MFRRKKQADPFAAFTETYGIGTPPRPPRDALRNEPEPEPTPTLSWAHRILGVSAGASPEDISAAYRRLAREHHPDVGGSDERMQEINVAYRELRR